MADLVETATQAEFCKTLLTLVEVAGLLDVLKNPESKTIFAPTDEAFEKLPTGTIEKLLGDIPQLTKILTYHIIAGKVMSKDVVKLDKTTTFEGSDLKIHNNGGVMVGDAAIVQSDLEADNGVIHAIDTVLIPQY